MTVEVKARTVKVTGPKGTLERAFKSNSFSAVMTTPRNLHVDIWFGNRKQVACLRTICTHIENMIKGVTKGYVYKMRFAYAHFPINVSTTPKMVEVRNFLGERRVRKVTMLDGVTVKRSEGVKDEITIEGNDLEKVSGSAALVHESCLVKNKDIRKFLDGLYVSEKGESWDGVWFVRCWMLCVCVCVLRACDHGLGSFSLAHKLTPPFIPPPLTLLLSSGVNGAMKSLM